jgi:DNA-binding MarR family transcriptional regulator
MATAAPQLTESQRQLWQSLVFAHGRVQTVLEKALQEAELPPLAWFDVLHPISQSEDGMLRPRDLGCGVQISRSGLTRLTDRMEAAGVIVRKRCDEDRRGSYIGLTEAGEQVAAAMRETIETELAMVFGDLFDEDEATQLAALLRRVTE